MYENIIGQDRVVSELGAEIRTGTLPASLLFYGRPYSGKLSAALETARILTCVKGTAEWNCSCRSCEQHRLLLHPQVLLLGSRYFAEEIAASADALLRTGKDSARYLFIRSVRKLLRRFDPFLWEGEEQKLQKVQTLIQSAEDGLSFLLPGLELPSEKELKKTVEAVSGDCVKIASTIVSDNIPINLIRRASYWVHISSPSERKIVILERADRMQENSRNALLKILEEPPEGVHFILLAERRSTVLPTILSRVRSYFFRERSGEDGVEILKKIFREDSGEYGSLPSFFLAWKGINPSALRSTAERFLRAVLTDNADREGSEALRDTVDTLDSQAAALPDFLEELAGLLRERLRTGNGEGSIPLSLLEALDGELIAVARESRELNINASLLLETLLYRMRDLVRGAASR